MHPCICVSWRSRASTSCVWSGLGDKGHSPERGNWGHRAFLPAVARISHHRERKLESLLFLWRVHQQRCDPAGPKQSIIQNMVHFLTFTLHFPRLVESKRQKHCWLFPLVSEPLKHIGAEGKSSGDFRGDKKPLSKPMSWFGHSLTRALLQLFCVVLNLDLSWKTKANLISIKITVRRRSVLRVMDCKRIERLFSLRFF